MKEDGSGGGGGEAMEGVRFARLLLTLALVAATTAAVRWLVTSHQKKKARAGGSDGTDVHARAGWQSADGPGSREVETDCLPRGDRPHSDTATQQTERGSSSSLRVVHAHANNRPPTTERLDTRPQPEGEQLSTKDPSVPQCPQKGITAAGVLALGTPYDCELRHLGAECGLSPMIPAKVGVLGPSGVEWQPQSDSLSPDTHCLLTSQADSLFLASGCRVGREVSQSHEIDYVAPGSDGDKRAHNQGNSESLYSLGNRSPADFEADTSLDTVDLCNGYALLCSKGKLCRAECVQGETPSIDKGGHCGVAEHTRNHASPLLVKETYNTNHTNLGLQAETLNSLLRPRVAREFQCPLDPCPVEKNSQAVQAVSGSTVFAEEIEAGTSCEDPTEGNLCTCFETGTGGIPGLECVGSEAVSGCKNHKRLGDLTCLKLKHDTEESDNGMTEADLRTERFILTNIMPSREGQSDHALRARNETTERERLQTELIYSMLELKDLQQGEGECIQRDQGLSKYDESLSVLDAQDRAIHQQQRTSVLGQGNTRLVQSTSIAELNQKGSNESQGSNTMDPEFRGSGSHCSNSSFVMQSRFINSNPGRAQLNMEISCCRGNNEIRTKRYCDLINTTTALYSQNSSEKENAQGKPALLAQESVTSKGLEEEELTASHRTSNNSEKTIRMSMQEVCTIAPAQHTKHKSSSLSTLSTGPTGRHKHSEGDDGLADRNSLILTNIKTTHEFEETDSNFGERDHEMVEPDHSPRSCKQSTAGNRYEEHRVNNLPRRPAKTSACPTKEDEQVPVQNTYPEVVLQNMTFSVNDLPESTREVFENELCKEAESPGHDRKDTHVCTSQQEQPFTQEQAKEALESAQSQENTVMDTYKAEYDHSVKPSIRKRNCDSNNIKYETHHGTQVKQPETAQIKMRPFPSQDDPFVFSIEAIATAAMGAECTHCDIAVGLDPLSKSSTWPINQALPKPIMSTAFEEQFSPVLHVTHKNPNVDQQLTVEYGSMTEQSESTMYNVLSPSPRIEKCSDACSLPEEEDSSGSVANEKTISHIEILEAEHSRKAPISNAKTDPCGAQPFNLPAGTEAAFSRRPTQMNGHSEEKREVGVLVQDISQIKKTYLMKATCAHIYNKCLPANMLKLYQDESHVCAVVEDQGPAHGQHKEILLLTWCAAENNVQENCSIEEDDFEDRDIRREDAHDNLNGSESQTCVHEANTETATCLPQKMDVDISFLASPRDPVSVGSSLSHFQKKKPGKNDLTLSHVSNEDPSCAKGVLLVSPSEDVEHHILSFSMAALSGLHKDHDHNPLLEEEGIFNNGSVACQPGGIGERILNTPAICLEELKILSNGSQVADLCDRGHKCSLGPVCAENYSTATQILPGMPSDREKVSHKETPQKQLYQFPKYAVQSKDTEGLIDLCEVTESHTLHGKKGSCMGDVDDSLKDDFEIETMLDGAHSFNYYPSALDSGTNEDSETSESGYTTENPITPAFEERSWSSLGTEGEQLEVSNQDLPVTLPKVKAISGPTSKTEGEQLEVSNQDLQVTLPKVKANSDSTSKTEGEHLEVSNQDLRVPLPKVKAISGPTSKTEGEQLEVSNQDLQVPLPKVKAISDPTSKTVNHQQNTEAAVNCKHINKNNTNSEDHYEEKNCKNEVGVDDCDNFPLTLNHTHASESKHMHIDVQNLHFKESMRVKSKEFNSEDKQSCKSSPTENKKSCSNANAENMMYNMSSYVMGVLEHARDQCHECNETPSTPNTDEERENISADDSTAVRHGQRAVEYEHKKRNGITSAATIQKMHPPDDNMRSDICAAGCLGIVNKKTEHHNQTSQIEPTGNNIQILNAHFEDIFSQSTLPQIVNISECIPNRYMDDAINGEGAVNIKKLSSRSYDDLGMSSTKSSGLLISGKQCHELSRSSGQTMSLRMRSDHRIVGQEQSKLKKTDEDNKSFMFDSTVDTYTSEYSQTKELETMNIFRENEIKNPKYFHHTSSYSSPRTWSLPCTAICQTHSTQELKSFIQINSNKGIDRARESEHRNNSNDNFFMPFNIHAQAEQVPRRSGLQRRGSISEIAENPELRICGTNITSPKTKLPLAKSCEDILSDAPSTKVDGRSKARSMLCLLTEHYSLSLSKNQKSPVEYVAKGSFLNIPETLQSTEDAMKMQLNLGNCLELLKFAKKNRAGDLQEAVYTVMSDNYLQVLRDPAIYGQLNGGERDRILQLRTRGKNTLCVAELETIYGLKKTIQNSSRQAVNELSPQSPCTDAQQRVWLYTFDMENNSWQPLTQIPEEANLKGCSICSMNNYLFLAGGIKGQGKDAICSNKVFCYNPLTEIWRQIMPMNQARSQLKLVPVDGYLYAIGGECLYTMEQYDPRLDKWIFKASLPKGSFAVAHEATTCNGEIYVSGGHLFYRLFKYSPLKDLWEECPYNTSRKRSCDMVAIRTYIYRFDIHRESGVSVFKYNTTTKVWNECATMCLSNPLPFCCVVLDGTVYCLNKNMTVRFTSDDRSQRFEPDTFRPFTGGSRGALCPFVLTMPQTASLQTSV